MQDLLKTIRTIFGPIVGTAVILFCITFIVVVWAGIFWVIGLTVGMMGGAVALGYRIVAGG